jgi:hypothetical protein
MLVHLYSDAVIESDEMTLASVLCPEGHLLAANEHSYVSAWSYKTGKRIESSLDPSREKNSPPAGAYIVKNFFARCRARGGERGGGKEKKRKKKKKKEEKRTGQPPKKDSLCALCQGQSD